MAIEDDVFNWCSALESIHVCGSITTIGKRVFAHCSSLTSITIPDGIMKIGGETFAHCSNLISATIPNSVTAIEYNAFWYCSSLTSITIPDGVTSIGDQAFAYCSSLTNITLPDSVIKFGDKVFESCSKLRELTVPSALADRLNTILPKGTMPVLHVQSIANLSAKYRPGAAIGFAEDDRDCTDENGKAYLKYIKSNAVKLVPLACEHPALLYLMIQEKLIAVKYLDAVSEMVQASGSAELIAAMLEYGGSAVSDKDKAKARAKKEKREENVTSFIFDTEKVEALVGKTIVVTGSLKTFTSRDELKECLSAVGAELTENLAAGVDFLLTNTPNSGTAKNKKAEELGVQKITEQEFNDLIGRRRE